MAFFLQQMIFFFFAMLRFQPRAPMHTKQALYNWALQPALKKWFWGLSILCWKVVYLKKYILWYEHYRCPFFCLWSFEMFLIWGYYKWNSYEHSCISFHGHIFSVFILFYFFSELGIKPRTLCLLGKCCITWGMPLASPGHLFSFLGMCLTLKEFWIYII
jgi:hypothetical protein